MPYIDKEKREKLDKPLHDLASKITSPGELNYVITKLCSFFVGPGNAEESPNEQISYSGLNEVMGVLKCVSHEFYRRMVEPYEDKKIEENGDIFYWR